jgi:hypothetical protein
MALDRKALETGETLYAGRWLLLLLLLLLLLMISEDE